MTSKRSSTGSARVGSFAEAERFKFLVTLRMTYAERLQELEGMCDFNDMIEEQNPRVRHIAELLRSRRNIASS